LGRPSHGATTVSVDDTLSAKVLVRSVAFFADGVK
jgi:hypothetical protein